MADLIPNASPFDSIRRGGVYDAHGEFWSARELMPLLGYERWERFSDAILRAQRAAENMGAGPEHFRDAAKMVDIGSGALREVYDVHFTRYGAYLVAMNGDPRKPEIAAAQTYFAVKTHEAETQTVSRLPDIATPEGVLAMAEQFTQTARALVAADAKIRELEPKALAHDQYLTADKGERLVREVAKLIGWKERDLRAFLLEEKLIFRKPALCGTYYYDAYSTHAQHFRPVESLVEHTWGTCAHYTLYVRPAGVELIKRRIEKRRASMQDAIGGAS